MAAQLTAAASGGQKMNWMTGFQNVPKSKGQRGDKRRPSVVDVREHHTKTMVGNDSLDENDVPNEKAPSEEEVLRLTKIQSAKSYTGV